MTTMTRVSTYKAANNHVCKHCQVVLKAEGRPPQPPFRIYFPHTIQEARAAAQDGCPIFIQLVTSYDRWTWWDLVKSHLLKECSCCSGALQRWTYALKSLSSKPFALLFLVHLYEGGPEPVLGSLIHLDCGNGPINPHYNVYTYAGDDAAALVPSLDRQVDRPNTTRSITEWLLACRCIDKPAQGTSFQPTRLLDMGEQKNEDSATLIETSGAKIQNYACLSYCWGGSQPMINSIHRQPSSKSWPIKLCELPRAFQDSIHVLRRIGLRYVWIDSLCIIQDDLDDKEREIDLMPHIYKNSALTLCISTARSCNESFLQPRREHSELQLKITMPDDRLGTMYLDRILWAKPPIEEPLNTRGWALQERLLSPRLLEYGWRTARWSCPCIESYSGYLPLRPSTNNSSSERSTDPSPSYNLFASLNPPGPRHIAQTKDELFACWVRLVYQYTRRNLTLPDDRLAAIGGVAAELQHRTGVPYLAGLWDYDRLSSLLLWKVDVPLRELRSRPVRARAPSWSWAAVDGAVSMNLSRGRVEACKVLSADVVGGFGTVAQGSVTVEGPVRRGKWWCDGWPSASSSSSSSSSLVTEPEAVAFSRPESELSIWPDCVDDVIEVRDDGVRVRALDVTFLAVGRVDWDHDIIRGLMLAKQYGKHYTRLGFFQARSDGMFSLADWHVEVVCIA